MKLYYAPGTCSLAPHIVAREAGLPLELVKVDIHKTPHRILSGPQAGTDYASVNPKGYVPALELDDGTLLTEVAAIVQYLADQAPASKLMPAAGTMQRYRAQEWLSFISSELHKAFSPWLFHPEVGEAAQAYARGMIARRFAAFDTHLASQPFLLGEQFSAADAYLFAIASWAQFTRIDLAPYPHLAGFLERVGSRATVKVAQQAERQPMAAAA